MTDEVLTELDNGLFIITLNRAQRRNAISPTMIRAIGEAANRAATDDAVRAVLIRGAGGYFCVGGDVQRMTEAVAPPSFKELHDDLVRRVEITKSVYNIPKPVVAQVDGAAAGAGLGLALACDFQIVADNAKLTTAFAKIGLSGDFATAYYVARAVGLPKAAELLMLSPVLTGKEAAAAGLVTRSVEPENTAATAMAIARSLSVGPTVALSLIKRNLRNAISKDYDTCFDLEVVAQTGCLQTADHQAAAAAFLQKRPPSFVGK